ncbi:MAG: hypothetical protein IJ083_12065 [Clostridia bacterium]|nr:hypothetical protein [Clostridia bacterium]
MPQDIRKPLLILTFPNFYCPAYDDRAFVDDAIRKIRDMHFTCVELDTKDQEDVHLRCMGEAPSQYMAQQEYMMDACERAGLGYMFLSLYMSVDNLYPHIRFSPPIMPSPVTDLHGKVGTWQKYWADEQRAREAEHVRELLSCYLRGHARAWIRGEKRLPMDSMWDPCVQPSFDSEGWARYVQFLKDFYGTIDSWNHAYGQEKADFSELRPGDAWFEAAFRRTCYTREEREGQERAFVMFRDNALWRRGEIIAYFRDMQERLHRVEPSLFLMPNLSQWGHYLNVNPALGVSPLWDTATRGIDMRAVSEHMDTAHYMTVPLTPSADPEPYAVSLQHAHIRSLNRGRPFLGGIFYGRFPLSDLYRDMRPEELIGSMVGSGASGIHAYGMGGMDDGGVLQRMDEDFCDSVARGNAWAARVIPQLGQHIPDEVAILYPTAASFLEPLSVEGAGEHRMGLIGLYRYLRGHGLDPEIVEAEDVIMGLQARVLFLAPDACYGSVRNVQMESALRQFVEGGGIVFHGPDTELALHAFGIRETVTDSRSFDYHGGLLPVGGHMVSFDGACIAAWKDGGNAVAENRIGKGRIYSFGYDPGLQYLSPLSPRVPFEEKNHALYPVSLSDGTPLDVLLEAALKGNRRWRGKRTDVEISHFEHGCVVVNHTSRGLSLKMGTQACDMTDPDDARIPGHSAAFVQGESGGKICI